MLSVTDAVAEFSLEVNVIEHNVVFRIAVTRKFPADATVGGCGAGDGAAGLPAIVAAPAHDALPTAVKYVPTGAPIWLAGQRLSIGI